MTGGGGGERVADLVHLVRSPRGGAQCSFVGCSVCVCGDGEREGESLRVSSMWRQKPQTCILLP